MPAAKKLPSYVKAISKNGRRTYKPEFIAGVVADYRSGKSTAAELRANYGLAENQVYAWASKVGHAPQPAEKPKGSLLARAKAATQPGRVNARIAEELELCLANLRGEVSDHSVCELMREQDKRKFMLTTWRGKVLGYAVAHGLLAEPK